MTLVAILVGSFALYTSSAQKSLYRMNELIVNALASDKPLAYEFQSVADVVRSADSAYVLEWTDDLTRFPQALFSEDGNPAAFRLQIVFAHFESGPRVACLFREMDANLYLCVAEE